MDKPTDQFGNNGNKRHTLRTLAGIEDGLAILIDILNETLQHQLCVDQRLLQLQKAIQPQPEFRPVQDYKTLVFVISIEMLNETTLHREFMDDALLKLQHILQSLRAGPNVYDPDTPCGRRPNNR